MKNQRLGQNGFTFIELMIAMAILAIGMMAAVSMQFSSTRNNTNGNIYTQASMLAKTQIEMLKSQDVSLLLVGSHPDPMNPIRPDGANGGIYSRSWEISNLGDGARNITVRVQWERLGRARSVEISSSTQGGGV
ncbi:MAG: prepilin-type N-terminal cleavage/methylation domain-containing protein [Desulfobacteraceae bacterium]|nr:MAG: prepilin-type N-terminal cleavage/methylation domain-containing protein [Desulfobacteraceae bacterium]